MQPLWVAVLCVCVAAVACQSSCIPDYCDRVDCSTLTTAPPCTGDAVLKPHGSPCGCCDACVQPLGEGQFCYFGDRTGGPAATGPCAEGLICDKRTNTCRKL
ncbi:uncharacterized protein [Periplaneta americana]|uniref:uncharacterized protein n=1 Tax=Periplaneta americana TaxID=6978 RepID=UPI0037E79F3D